MNMCSRFTARLGTFRLKRAVTGILGLEGIVLLVCTAFTLENRVETAEMKVGTDCKIIASDSDLHASINEPESVRAAPVCVKKNCGR